MDIAEEEGRWKKHKTLGAGSFGQVELWRNDYTQNVVAIKRCKGGASQLTEKQRERWVSEVKTMNTLSHPNIVGTRRVPTQLLNMEGLPVLCMEYCSRGDLRTALNESANCCGIEETEALKIMRHISSAVEYLHSQTLTHRDLKPENIVLQGTKEKTIYKLTDFGYVRELGEESVDASVVGTRNYLAPELLWKPAYTCSVDYWSLGILFYEVITGNRPLLCNMPITETWMRYMKAKKYEHICARGSSGSVTFSSEIETPTTISDCMREPLTRWFRVALQWNPRMRGRLPEKPDELVIFSWLKGITQTKIVRVFTASLFRTDSYAVPPNITVHGMQSMIQERTGIEVVNQTLTDHHGYAVNQVDAPLFSCIEAQLSCERDEVVFQEPHLVLFQRDKLRMESPPKPSTSPPMRQMMNNPKQTCDYDTMRRYYAAALFFIKHELDLFRSYVIALSIKIDLTNRSLESLRENVESSTNNANSLMNQLNHVAQSPEYGLMSAELRETLDTTIVKTRKLLEGAQQLFANVNALSADLEQLKAFSDPKWLDKWTQLHEKATDIYEKNLQRNPGQRDAPLPMVRLLYDALKLHGEQLQNPEIDVFVNEVTRFDTNILQLQESLSSFEALVDAYRRNLDDITAKRLAEASTIDSLTASMSENDVMMLDNILMHSLLDGALNGFPSMDVEELDFL